MQPPFDLLPAGATSVLALGAIYAVAALFSGLSGFGFSAIGSLSLLILPPQLGVAVLMALSMLTQAFSLGSLWRELRQPAAPGTVRQPAWPYLVGGTLGMPFGLALLTVSDARSLTTALGVLLVAYAAWSLFKPSTLTLKAKAPSVPRSMLVGAAGGVVGGFSAFPGCALVVWNGLLGIGKQEGRAIVQPFILWMQAVGLVLLVAAHASLFGRPFWGIFLAGLPAAWLGNSAGIAIYRRTGDVGYRHITLIALGVSGAGLLLKLALR